jgi:hypothetical protein
LTAHFGADFAAGDAVFDPELAHGGIAMGKRRAVIGERMRKIGRIEIEAHAALFRPVDPALEMGRGDVIALHFFAVEIGVAGVQIQTVPTGQKREGLFNVLPQFTEGPRLAGIISRGLDAPATQRGTGCFKTADIITLPAMKREGNGGEPLQYGLRVDAKTSVGFLRK